MVTALPLWVAKVLVSILLLVPAQLLEGVELLQHVAVLNGSRKLALSESRLS